MDTTGPLHIRSASPAVRQGDADSLPSLAGCDFSFQVAAELVEPFDMDTTVPVEPPYQKRYPFHPGELAEYLERPDRQLWTAEVAGAAIGYLAVAHDWNRYAVVDDLAVDAAYRGAGAARLLMDAAVAWAKDASLAGVRLETQSNNIAACRFYRRYGFRLGGYDRYLYRGLEPGTREVALFWYLPFEERAAAAPV
ncbi:GNAT family N-acetyltransferase [Cupriavidus sp. AU9028]|uniref:GNAT family N-acetyltransferase n=1 Tax=Cupriavidus sp. AU9028 TaxID=2871157 RepID=UPI001C97538A|nr:GNAT family N-acetyltransferase [Cupriavidus sp. AU9028]MBY4897016.1 GNAT family N-acetyltransferase [Cupriavidus sp. AU9028]